MKKKAGRKLLLSRETVRTLVDRDLLNVDGGATTGCSGTSSGAGCTATLWSDCRCGTSACPTVSCDC